MSKGVKGDGAFWQKNKEYLTIFMLNILYLVKISKIFSTLWRKKTLREFYFCKVFLLFYNFI